MAPHVLLTLDLATTFGFALGDVVGDATFSGSKTLRGDHPEEKAADLIGWLLDLWDVSPWDRLVYEAPIESMTMGGKTNQKTAQILLSLPVVAGAISLRLGVRMDRIRRAKIEAVRKHFVGVARMGDRHEMKQAVIRRCNQLGWYPVDDNEADALALYDYVRGTLRADHAARSGPLFDGVRS